MPVSLDAAGGPAYAIDDQTAIKVTDGTVEVVSEGHWKPVPSAPRPTASGVPKRPLIYAADRGR